MSVPIQILKYVHAHPFCNLADLLNHVHPRGYTYSDVYRIFKDLRASNAILFFNGEISLLSDGCTMLLQAELESTCASRDFFVNVTAELTVTFIKALITLLSTHLPFG